MLPVSARAPAGLRASARAGHFVAIERREIIKIVVSMRDGRHNPIA
jgi:hypothetical protein